MFAHPPSLGTEEEFKWFELMPFRNRPKRPAWKTPKPFSFLKGNQFNQILGLAVALALTTSPTLPEFQVT